MIHVASGEYRLRVRYGKVGRLRWLSQLELVRALERSVRRAGLEYAVTQGFSPHMKIAFGPALPVGTAGENEYYDVWLKRYTTGEEALESLSFATPEDLRPSEVRYVSESERALGAALTIARYRVAVEGKESAESGVRDAIESLVSSGTLTVQHKGKAKVFDLTRSLPEETRVSESVNGSEVELAVRIGPEGSLRPDVLVRSAIQAAALDAHVSRTTRTETLTVAEGGDWVRPL